MPSRLSSLLVRDGVVAVKRMERAFQRQVLHGGALDTVLLEMNLVPVERLAQYLSLATGLPPASFGEVETRDDRAVEKCPKDLALAHRVVPISLAEEALRVLVCDPVDLASLEALANELSCPIQPLVVPEFQFRVAFAQVYATDAEDRFTKLAELARASEPVVPVGQSPTVIIADEATRPEAAPIIEPEVSQPQEPPEERVRGKRPKPEQPERRQTMELSTDALRDHIAATEELAKSAPRVDTESEVSAPVAAAPAPPAVDALAPAPLPVGEARRLLAEVTERKEVFAVFLRALRSRSEWAGIFLVQGGKATGRVALAEAFDREDVAEVSVPLDASSPLRQAVERKSFYIGAARSGTEAVDSAVARIAGGHLPAALLVLPIVLRDRVVALACAHRYREPLTVADVTELLPLANVAAEALSRAIVRAKAGGAASAGNSAPVLATVPEGSAPAPAPAATPAPEPAPEPEPAPADDGAMAELLGAIESDDAEARERAMAEALERAPEMLRALESHFPGRLLVERKDGEKHGAAEHGPVLDLVTRLGAGAGELLAEKMRDNDREVRYYATLCASEIRPPNAVSELVERLFDADRETRALATQGLAGYDASALDEALDFARRALHSEDIERLKAATDAIARLGDVRAIPDLLDAHSRGGDAAQAARKALLALTKQDFATSNRKWRNWWTKNQSKHRIEWMLEGLAHKSAEVRKSAADDLRTLTGEYFGFHHDLPKKERDQARQRWQQWWTESGRQRFLRADADEDERLRPTAVLPRGR